jgi:hypothetical protein
MQIQPATQGSCVAGQPCFRLRNTSAYGSDRAHGVLGGGHPGVRRGSDAAGESREKVHAHQRNVIATRRPPPEWICGRHADLWTTDGGRATHCATAHQRAAAGSPWRPPPRRWAWLVPPSSSVSPDRRTSRAGAIPFHDRVAVPQDVEPEPLGSAPAPLQGVQRPVLARVGAEAQSGRGQPSESGPLCPSLGLRCAG